MWTTESLKVQVNHDIDCWSSPREASLFVGLSLPPPFRNHSVDLDLRSAYADKSLSSPRDPWSTMNGIIEADLENLNKRVIQPWLNECQQQHPNCKSPHRHDSPNYPTRLVWVGNKSNDIVKLVETGKKCPRYLILSYCWGKSNDSAKTTDRNYTERTKAINISALPKTIRDAIKLTRAMGEEYVWIDAICIKQTDKGHTGDWETEASKVGDYYANAECLISAVSARESEEGFLGESSYASEWEVLSGHNQHAWDDKDKRLKMCTILQQGKKDALGESWAALVCDYSGRNLTVEGDRLVAIQGIASRLARQHGDTYCAGVFGSDLAHGLLWERTLDSFGESHDFPSWSWASVSGKVEWPYFLAGSLDGDCLAELVRFPCHGPVFDFAEMSSRELLIKTPLLKLFLKHNFTKTGAHKYLDVNRTEILGPKKWEEMNLPIEVFIIQNLADKDTIVRLDAGLDAGLVAAIILRHEKSFAGILLKPVCINGKEAYMRQGTFSTIMVLKLHDETSNISLMKSEITLV
ncbi:het domain pin-c1 [Fusarium longipes]|uniref:Het domain pin-c1 n=1 Tax=Fusarium longipes TaxID=694270 RepID=A0A395T5G6_9HYPO|nr:het domain pin-c1 [Fusarium longipes]